MKQPGEQSAGDTVELLTPLDGSYDKYKRGSSYRRAITEGRFSALYRSEETDARHRVHGCRAPVLGVRPLSFRISSSCHPIRDSCKVYCCTVSGRRWLGPGMLVVTRVTARRPVSP